MEHYDDRDTQERLNVFLSGDTWKGICDAAEDCEDSLELMEELSLRVSSLVFYLERNITNKAIIEEQELIQLINTYEN